MFSSDIETDMAELNKKLKNKSVLVIGGAGSIGSSFIKTIIPFKLSELVVVDINENALTEYGLTACLEIWKRHFKKREFKRRHCSCAERVSAKFRSFGDGDVP